MKVSKSSFNYRLIHFFLGENNKPILPSDYLIFLLVSYIFLLLIISSLLPLPIVIIFKIQTEVMLNLMVVSSLCWIIFIIYLIFRLVKCISKRIKAIDVIFED